MGFEEQVASIYVGVKGYLDKVTSKEVVKFEKEFLRKLHSSHPEILASIKKEQKITDENESALKKVIEEFLTIFSDHAPSAHFDHAGLSDRLAHDKRN